MMINNLQDSEAVKRKREIRKLGTAPNLGDSSVTTPGKRIRIGQPGAGGYLEAGGRLFWEGLVEFIGETKLDGDVRITLSLYVGADTTLDGNTTITGTTELQSNLNVTGSGKITAGNVQISPAATGGGAIIPVSGPLYIGGPAGVKLAENVEVIASLNVGEYLLNPGIEPSSSGALRPVMVNPSNGRFYYAP
jgi:hypothetical protein